jgi:hypothetical protein
VAKFRRLTYLAASVLLLPTLAAAAPAMAAPPN